MALDTAAKRGSAMFIRSPWRRQFPLPDGTIDQGDRQATAYMYSGILAEEAAANATLGGLEYTAENRLLEFTAHHRRFEYTAPERRLEYSVPEHR